MLKLVHNFWFWYNGSKNSEGVKNMTHDIHILSCLIKEPMHGYEIKKNLDAFMKSKITSNSALYPRLKEMEKKGYIFGKTIEQEGKPNRTEYCITPKGEKYFIQSINKFTPLSFKSQSEFFLRVYYFDLIEPKVRKKLLQSRLEFIMRGIDVLQDNKGYDEQRSIYSAMSNRYSYQLLELELKLINDCMVRFGDPENILIEEKSQR